jgi:hypothetical protein
LQSAARIREDQNQREDARVKRGGTKPSCPQPAARTPAKIKKSRRGRPSAALRTSRRYETNLHAIRGPDALRNCPQRKPTPQKAGASSRTPESRAAATFGVRRRAGRKRRACFRAATKIKKSRRGRPSAALRTSRRYETNLHAIRGRDALGNCPQREPTPQKAGASSRTPESRAAATFGVRRRAGRKRRACFRAATKISLPLLLGLPALILVWRSADRARRLRMASFPTPEVRQTLSFRAYAC